MPDGDQKRQTLAPPAVTALKESAAGESPGRVPMERTVSMDMKKEREDLREAAEHCLNVIVDLDLDGKIRWASPSWQDVIGTRVESVLGEPISELLVGNGQVFAEAMESMAKDDSRSKIIRFAMKLGPDSVLKPKPLELGPESECQGEPDLQSPRHEDGHIVNLEAQGITVFDQASGGDSHTMWMIRPSVIREVTIDLPEILVEALGVGAEMLASYLTALAEVGANDPGNHAPPLPVLCRICERQITPWWFEKHTELCLQEHKAEMDVQMAQENLADHRNAIVKVLDSLEAAMRQLKAAPQDLPAPTLAAPEYKGMPIPPTSNPSSVPSSGRSSPANPQSHSRERPGGFGHHRAKSFAIRRPVSRIVELVLDLCDTALEINTPAIKDTRTQLNAEIRTQSPQSESRISQVLQWQSPSTGALEHEQGLSMLCDDTSTLARAKVDAVYRHRRILEYSERIRVEFDVLVQECVEEALRKAARLAAGEDSDSTDAESQLGEEEPEQELELELEQDDVTPGPPPVSAGEEEMFPGSFDPPPPMARSFQEIAEVPAAPNPEARIPSAAGSTRSSSPRGTQTPRSHAGALSLMSQSKRASMHFESDAGMESDSSMRSSIMSGPRRADSPNSEYGGLSRVASSRERKRKSLVLPSVMTSRQHSPARNIIAPSSPLRMAKPRIPSGAAEGVQSPITSPVLAGSEFSSPAIAAQRHHHRRQSSTAGSDPNRPTSPRMVPVSAPQPRAVPPSIKDFEIIKPISKGAFGSVYLAKKKSTGDYFAIKVLKKADMVAKNQVTNVKAERAIMMWQGESDFVAKLYWTFSNKDFLYLVMEYLNGGDCASLVKVLGGLPEDWAKKYLAEVVLGVEHLHSRGIVHRDLKPDNLLIDHRGHLKLTDFGLSRMGVIGRQERAQNRKAEEAVPDLLRQGPFHRAPSVASSRSASFDLQGGSQSPSQTPSMVPSSGAEVSQPSYFSLNRDAPSSRERSRRTSGNRSDSGDSEAFQSMFRRFSIVDDSIYSNQRRSPIEEELVAEDGGSPDPYLLQPLSSQPSFAHNSGGTPPQNSAMLPPPMALFDPEDKNRRFVGTPDYLAPETIDGSGQDEMSDWWSLGCILFECLYGYPPFHAETPEAVFQNILARKIAWPEEDLYQVSEEAIDLMNKLMCTDPRKRLGSNQGERYSGGPEEIKRHPWFEGINWDTLREDEASFVPAPENPEDTEYFDPRGATIANFAPEFEDPGNSSASTPGAEYVDRPHDALSRVRSQVSASTMKRGLIPLHIPPHVREGRSRRLSEPVATDDFGNFNYKNLPVLEKANKDVIQKLRAEAMQAQSKSPNTIVSPVISSPTPSLESSPLLPMPLKRTISTNKSNRPASPSISQSNSSPSRGSQPSSPLLVSFSTGQHHERRKTSSGSSTLSHSTSNPGSLQPGNFFDIPRLVTNPKIVPSHTSPNKLAKTPTAPTSAGFDRGFGGVQRQNSLSLSTGAIVSPRARSQTIGSQEGETREPLSSHYKRRSQVLDVSPSSSDTEDSRQKALLRVQRRRQSSRRLSYISLENGPIFRPLDVLVCEDHPVSQLVMERLLGKLRCRTITAKDGPGAVRYALSDVKFDIIMMEFKLPQINGADVARMIRETKNANSHTPVVAVTGYLKELQAPHHFDALIEKPATTENLTEVLGRLLQWKPPPPNWTPGSLSALPTSMPSGLRQESTRLEDSPTSNSSGFPAVPSGSYRSSSREESVSSSFFGDADSRSDEVPVIISRQGTDDWRDKELARMLGGLGISGPESVVASEPKQILAPAPRSPSIQQNSAPPILEHKAQNMQQQPLPAPPVPPPRHPDRLTVTKRQPSFERRRRAGSAESGDDEDEELGDVQVRAKSPKGRGKPSSKLGHEMLRTNSRGSVVSTEDNGMPGGAEAFPPMIPPPPIKEEAAGTPAPEDGAGAGENLPKGVTITPPEIFPRLPGHAVQEIDMDATPRPLHVKRPS